MDELSKQLAETLIEINFQMGVTVAKAREMKVDVYQLQDMHGVFLYAPLLVAKAQILSALASLKSGPPEIPPDVMKFLNRG